MQAQLSAMAYVIVALCAAYFLTRSTRNEHWYRASFVFWFGSVAVLFLFPDSKEFMLTALAIMLLFAAPSTPEQKLPFLTLVFVAVPVGVNAPIPFPRINYLFTMDFQILLGILIAAPALFKSQGPNDIKSGPIGSSKIFMVAYFAIITFLMFRVLPLTATFRFATEIILGNLLLYLFILKFAVSEKILEKSMDAMYTAAVLLACIALLTQIKIWNFYSLVDANVSAYEFRYGILRTNTTINSVLLGFMEAVGLILVFRHREIFGRLPKYGWLIILLLVMGYTVSLSRGAWLSGIVVFAMYLLLKSRLSSFAVSTIGLACGGILAFMAFSGDGFSENLDPFQTFDYRKQLYVASWEQFQSAPFFGDPYYLDSGRFDHLVQGQGIIDIVSIYLQVVLQYGIIGLLFFIAPFLFPLGAIMKTRKHELSLQHRTIIAALGAFISGYLALILTVSDVSLITEYGIILAAFASAGIVSINRHISVRNKKEL